MKKLLPLLFLLACNTPQNLEATNTQNTEQLKLSIPKIRYIQDERTDLCFAYFYQTDQVGSPNFKTGGPAFTNVPCSPEVMKLIEKKEMQNCATDNRTAPK